MHIYIYIYIERERDIVCLLFGLCMHYIITRIMTGTRRGRRPA